MQATKDAQDKTDPPPAPPAAPPAATAPAVAPAAMGAAGGVFLGRQPIFDLHSNVFAYELLFRSSDANRADARDGDRATLATVDSTLNLMGLRDVVGGKLAFINFTRELVLRDAYRVLPHHQTVVELLEDVVIDAQLIDACRRLKDNGYLLALDDFVFSPEYEPLLAMADIVKLDVLLSDAATCHAIIEKHRRPGLSFLAEKVENYAVFQQMTRIGCRYFQGYYFCKPQVLSAKPLSGAKQQYLKLINDLTATPFDYESIEQTIKAEVSLSVKLLRYLNSSAVGLPHKVGSIRQAIALLGEQKLKRWGALVAVTCLSEDKPVELARICLVRARFCELLGPALKGSTSELDLFLLGLLSAIDALTDRPLADILQDLSVTDELKSTLMGGNTPLGKLLLMGLACERGDFKRAMLVAKWLGMTLPEVAQAYRTAMHWADGAMGSVATG